MNISGNVKVKAKVNDMTGFISYRTVFTNKKADGETEFASMFINFVGEARNKPVDNDQMILVKKGFIAFKNDSEGKAVWNLVVQDFDYQEDVAKSVINETFNIDDDLPF